MDFKERIPFALEGMSSITEDGKRGAFMEVSREDKATAVLIENDVVIYRYDPETVTFEEIIEKVKNWLTYA